MTPAPKPELESLLRELDATPPEPDVAARLRRARQRAVLRAEPQRTGSTWMPLATFATAASVALILTLARPPAGLPPDLSQDPDAALFVFAGEDAELLEELEFFDWLERQGYAG